MMRPNCRSSRMIKIEWLWYHGGSFIRTAAMKTSLQKREREATSRNDIIQLITMNKMGNK